MTSKLYKVEIKTRDAWVRASADETKKVAEAEARAWCQFYADGKIRVVAA
jgi:hypothetical protein